MITYGSDCRVGSVLDGRGGAEAVVLELVTFVDDKEKSNSDAPLVVCCNDGGRLEIGMLDKVVGGIGGCGGSGYPPFWRAMSDFLIISSAAARAGAAEAMAVAAVLVSKLRFATVGLMRS